MTAITRSERAFKRAVIISISAHLGLFIFIIISPYLPKPHRRGMVHYVNFVNLGGGEGPGGGGGGAPGGGGGAPPPESEEVAETQVPERQTLRDLTTPQNLKERTAPSLTHPVDKPKRERKPKPKKTASIQKTSGPAAKSKSSPSAAAKGSGTGPGVGIGVGPGGSGGGGGLGIGFGPGYGGGSGFSNLPYAYYLQTLHARVSANWFTSQIRTGLTGDYHTIVRFRILRTGRISNPEVQESSGISTMDLSAIRAVRNASPFPPLPPEYDGEYMVIVLYFQHGKQS